MPPPVVLAFYLLSRVNVLANYPAEGKALSEAGAPARVEHPVNGAQLTATVQARDGQSRPRPCFQART